MINPSETLLSILRRFEGLHRVGPDGLIYPYICPAGYPTQGYGRLLRFINVPPITRERAEEWLIEDATHSLLEAIRLSPILTDCTDGQQSAIGSFVFNLGPTRYAHSTLRRCVNANDWEKAKEQIVKWVWAGGKKLPGLILRRNLEASLM